MKPFRVPRSALKDSLAPGRALHFLGSSVAFRVVCVVAAVPAFLSPRGTLSAQGDRWDQQVTHALELSAKTLGLRGYQAAGAVRTGLLFVDESARVEFPVSGKGEYVVVGACDEDCNGLQLVIANGTGYELDAARGPSNAPIVKVSSPMLPGIYRVTVTMSGCRLSPCRFGVAAFTRGPHKLSAD